MHFCEAPGDSWTSSRDQRNRGTRANSKFYPPLPYVVDPTTPLLQGPTSQGKPQTHESGIFLIIMVEQRRVHGFQFRCAVDPPCYATTNLSSKVNVNARLVISYTKNTPSKPYYNEMSGYCTINGELKTSHTRTARGRTNAP